MQSNDPYSLQLDFASVAAEIPPSEPLVCLDYDHIVFRPDILSVAVPADGFLMSSEVTSTDAFSRYGFGEQIGFFFNISLMAAKAALFCSLKAHWIRAYADFRHAPSERHKIEFAFTLALHRIGLPGQPCEPSLQSNWKCRVARPAMFHYGGVTSEARLLKKLVSKSAALDTADAQPESVPLLHTNLTAALHRLAPEIIG
jgi:hypothetical protein